MTKEIEVHLIEGASESDWGCGEPATHYRRTLVDGDEVLAWNDLDDTWSRVHDLSAEQQERARKLAATSRHGEQVFER